ncbi:PREDICTED: meiotic nuclear division protein 1 homolog [Papilio xuthus]|uniref:Meiotic nuclear division protein 1 homolog n=1 Tax=Papilio xuthus TaxID=66420 RepID=A0A194Q2Q4_PAPXU|nr:PREDICTED: meiotic nuclear division protein 1 homolog [Papilio xuthus]KPI99826.1 Meiotic nuclear division protein 1-like [Papilio xuthus]
MSKKRGLSADEKRTRMLEIFHQSKDFFQLKELEKIAPKEKGITMQSVKEVIQSLVDDHLVDSEKIGTSIYFWSFPSKAKNAKKRKLNDVQNELNECVKKLKKTEDSITSESVGRVVNEEREKILATLEQVTKTEVELKKELQKYRDCDPEYIAALTAEIEELKSATNRWTENIYILKSYIKNTFQMENEVIEQNFNIPQDLDYINA